MVGKRTLVRRRMRRRRRGWKAKQNQKIVFLSPIPLEHLSWTGLLVYGELSQHLGMAGASIHLEQLPTTSAPEARVEATLRRITKRSPVDAWVLYRMPRAVQRFVQRLAVPAVVFGNAYPGIELPALEVDHAAALRHAIAALERAGHNPRSVVLVLPESEQAGNLNVEASFLAEIGSRRKGQILKHGEDCGDFEKVAHSLLRKRPRPTAVIVFRNRMAARLLGFIPHRLQFCVPADLSLLCLDDAPFMADLVPEITRYRTDARRAADWCVHALQRQLSSGIRKSWEHRPIVPDFIRGETLAPPPKAAGHDHPPREGVPP